MSPFTFPPSSHSWITSHFPSFPTTCNFPATHINVAAIIHDDTVSLPPNIDYNSFIPRPLFALAWIMYPYYILFILSIAEPRQNEKADGRRCRHARGKVWVQLRSHSDTGAHWIYSAVVKWRGESHAGCWRKRREQERGLSCDVGVGVWPWIVWNLHKL